MLPRNKIVCIALMKYFEYVGEQTAIQDLPVTDVHVQEDDSFVCFIFRRCFDQGDIHVHVMVDAETGSTVIRDLP